MPRRQPGSLRRRTAITRSPWIRYRDVPGLSGPANAAVRLLEGQRWLPGMVAAAIGVWGVHAYGSRRRWRPWEAEFTCSCCGEGWARLRLEEAIAELPGHAARELRAVVDGLDDALLRRTHHDPQTPGGDPWWLRRC